MDLIDRRLCLLAELLWIKWEIERARELEAVNELSPPNTEFAPFLGAVRADRESCSDVDN